MPALAEQNAREVGARGVGSFLSHHESCEGGFEIARNGAGRLHVVCSGCGEHSRYGALDTDELRAHGVDLSEVAAGSRFPRGRGSLERWLPAPPALPWWVPNAYIVVVILVGLGLVAFGVLGPRKQQGPSTTERPAVQTAPAEQRPEPAPPPTAAGAVGAESDARSPQRPSPARVKPRLRRVTVLGRFAIGVPERWTGGTSGGAVVFRAPSRDAELRVFLERGTAERQRLYEQAARFLAREHRGARIRRQAPGVLGGLPAVRLVAERGSGKAWAALLSAGGYTYFVIADVHQRASRQVRAAAVASLRSFRPR